MPKTSRPAKKTQCNGFRGLEPPQRKYAGEDTARFSSPLNDAPRTSSSIF